MRKIEGAVKDFPITRVSGPETAGSWSLFSVGPNEWVLVPEAYGPQVSGELAATFPADSYARALELAKIVQASVEEHGRRAVMREAGEGARGRFFTDAAARFFGRLARRDRER